MLDLTKKPKYFYLNTGCGMYEKYHITRIGRHNQVLAHPVNTIPGRSCKWFDNDDSIYAAEEEIMASIRRYK